MKIPIIINNRNLLTWPKKMIEVIKSFDNVGEIIIVDNESTYEPLLEWYEKKPCQIVFSKNNGQSCPWDINLPEKLNQKYYVVTDSDLDLSQTPKDCLTYIREKMEKYQEYSKIGLSLSNWDVSVDSPYHHFLRNWAINNWDTNSVVDGLLTGQIFDTTFGMYNLEKHPHSGKNCTTYSPYSANHIPWEITNQTIKNMKDVNFEFYYYLKNATSASSYKRFIGFENLYG